jgi:hypothetical protein
MANQNSTQQDFTFQPNQITTQHLYQLIKTCHLLHVIPTINKSFNQQYKCFNNKIYNNHQQIEFN